MTSISSAHERPLTGSQFSGVYDSSWLV